MNYKNLIQEKKYEWIELWFSDLNAVDHHFSVPASAIDSLVEEGKMFDGSSIVGWQSIDESDLLLKLTDEHHENLFCQKKTLVIRCSVHDPLTLMQYHKDVRAIANKAEQHLKNSGMADTAYFGPEPEFFVFDSAAWSVTANKISSEIMSDEGSWNSDLGALNPHRPQTQGGYAPTRPVDSLSDLRTEMCDNLERLGIETEVHHHEVGGAGQCEIGCRFDSLLLKADQLQTFKHCIKNTAYENGQTATFLPKPFADQNGVGMHCHISLFKDGTNLFAGEEYAGLSKTALYFIAGIVKHAKAINAFANPTTNSYRRLVPGYEAPVLLAYSARNRSASIRIPFVDQTQARRIEVRFGDATANPYLLFSALLMAGLDGVDNQLDYGEPMDKDLYDLPPQIQKNIPSVCSSLSQALEELDKDRDFLLKGNVFNNELIDSYIATKQEEIRELASIPHPAEFKLYYSR